MPYKDPEKQREYQRLSYHKRRQQWLDANGPCVDCGSWEQLEVDHDDPSTKVDHKVWSWSAARRDAELQKCSVRCRACHLAKSNRERATHPEHGTFARYTHKTIPCRCELCRRANRDRTRIYREQTGKTQTFYNRRKARRANNSPLAQ